jgi:chaperone required for assembly of F1-ATPase
LVVPSRELAQRIASEWDAQEKTVDPNKMPFTRMANSAIDKLGTQHSEVADMLAAYGDADLLCCRAKSPQELVDRQSEHWDPPLDWAAMTLGARLEPRGGVIHAPQDPAALQALSDRVHAFDAFELAAFHDLVTLSGSLVLAFAAVHEWRDPDTIWQMSRLDDLWQEEQWGRDEEAHETAEIKRQAFLQAHDAYHLCVSG